MRTLIIFEASDGSRFDYEKECVEHEELISAIGDIMLTLPIVRLKVEGQYQHSLMNVTLCWTRLIELYNKMYRANYSFDAPRRNIISRVVSDSNTLCLKNAFYRFLCINFDTGIEYDQPYFAEKSYR